MKALCVVSCMVAGLIFITGCKPTTLEPYVQNVTQTAATVIWRTSAAAETRLRYRPAGGGVTEYLDSTLVNVHEVRLDSLAPETAYEYQVVSSELSDEFIPFSTEVTAGSPFKYLIWGDNQDGTAVFNKLVPLMAAEKPLLALCPGDLADSGMDEDEVVSQFLIPINPLARSVPTYVAFGNHDYDNRFYEYGSELTVLKTFLDQPGDFYNFAKTVGNTRFIIIDTHRTNDKVDLSPSTATYQFVASELASTESTSATFRVVMFHEPGAFNDCSPLSEGDVTNYLVPLFEKFNVDLVVNGHTHSYQRGRPVASGPYYLITGGAGGPLNEGCTQSNMDMIQLLNHYCSVSVNATSMQVRAIDSNGAEFDSFTINAR